MHLALSANRRRLVRPDGSAFFYLGDTAWNLFQFLDREECDFYLRTRAAQGFTVIQCVLVAEQVTPDTPNRLGHAVFPDNDPLRPNPAFFEHVDWVVERASALGLVVGLLPTWGDKWNQAWGVGPEIFTPENARCFGVFLGRRYREAGLVWILGGDRVVASETHRAVIRSLAEGLRSGDDGTHLITFHPNGGFSSAGWAHDEPWLDFHMRQSGHAWPGLDRGGGIRDDLSRNPVKPVLDGEPCYEDHPIMGAEWEAPYHGLFETAQIRQAAWAAVLNGACGHTYGCHDVWQFFGAGGRGPLNGARTPWRRALFLPGAAQMRVVREVMERLDWMNLVAAPEIVVSCDTRLEAGRTSDGRTVVVYFPRRVHAALTLAALAGETLAACWISPEDGSVADTWEFPRPAWTRTRAMAHRCFTPPREGDWVLRLDGAA